jgi:hypothetical protein
MRLGAFQGWGQIEALTALRKNETAAKSFSRSVRCRLHLKISVFKPFSRPPALCAGASVSDSRKEKSPQ